MLYQRWGSSDSASRNLVCSNFVCAIAPRIALLRLARGSFST
jgi:hypothetical protein